jgi:hypothetical protein
MCGKEYNDIKDVMSCESNCYPEYEKKRQEKFNAELTEDMNKLNTLREEYIRFSEKMLNKYDKKSLVKFLGMFGVQNTFTIDMVRNKEQYGNNVLDKIFGLIE